MSAKILLLLTLSFCCVTLQDEFQEEQGAKDAFTCSEAEEESCRAEDNNYFDQITDTLATVKEELKTLNVNILLYIVILFILLWAFQNRQMLRMYYYMDEVPPRRPPPPAQLLFVPVVFSAELSNPLKGEKMIIKYDRVVANIGNGYDKETGKFKAPYPGTYNFSAMADCENKTCFYISSKSNPAYADRLAESSGLMTARTSVVLNLKAGDEVCVYLLFGDLRANEFQVHSSFTGIRLA